MSNICEHDYLRRKCPFCEIAQLERENEQLRAELDRTERENRVLSGIAEKLRKENRKLREERDKLIEGITYFMREFGKIPVSSATAGAGHAYRRMHDILKDIGVMDI